MILLFNFSSHSAACDGRKMGQNVIVALLVARRTERRVHIKIERYKQTNFLPPSPRSNPFPTSHRPTAQRSN